jgi:hypothetical protein
MRPHVVARAQHQQIVEDVPASVGTEQGMVNMEALTASDIECKSEVRSLASVAVAVHNCLVDRLGHRSGLAHL